MLQGWLGQHRRISVVTSETLSHRNSVTGNFTFQNMLYSEGNLKRTWIYDIRDPGVHSESQVWSGLGNKMVG